MTGWRCLLAEAAVWGRLKPILRDDLNYVELTGCDHQNSLWQDEGWVTQVTGSFCGAWWKGDCVDMSPPGYALVSLDGSGGLKHYYRASARALGVASPRPGQVVGDRVAVDAMDPETGAVGEYTMNASAWPAGWRCIEVVVGERTECVWVFRRPSAQACVQVDEPAAIEFELLVLNRQPLALRCNGESIGAVDGATAAPSVQRLPIRAGLLQHWNTVRFDGDAVIRAPRLVVGERRINDPRVSHFYSLRPRWFGAGRDVSWDVSCRLPKTPWRYPEAAFYFPL